MIDPRSEILRTLAEMAAEYPWPDGKRPTVQQIYRWTTEGSRGVMLEALDMPGCRMTSDEAMLRFLQTLTAKRTQKWARRTTARQNRMSARKANAAADVANERLRAVGL